MSSASLAASLGEESQAAVMLHGAGELWVATVAGRHPPLPPSAMPGLQAVADLMSAAIERHLGGGWSPTVSQRTEV